jgi:chorismate-pyruvate lyase
MSEDLYNDPFKDPIVGRIIAKERELRRRIDAAAAGESEEVLNKLYNKRYNIFSAAEKMPIVLLSHIQQYGRRC